MNRFVALAPAGLLRFAMAALVLSVGCGTEISTSGSTGTGGSTSTSTAATGTGGGPTTTCVGCGAVCGGLSGATCAADQFCDFPDNTCGSADGQGVCAILSGDCPSIYAPVCGCDGKFYDSPCSAYVAGQDISALGGCPAPVGMFGCGAAFCHVKTQYCQAQLSDVASQPTTYACMELPAACGGVGSCACLASAPCGQACAATSDGGLKVSCPGG